MHYQCQPLRPVTGPQVKLPTIPHVIHDLINAPGRILVSGWVIWWYTVVILKRYSHLERFYNLVVILVCIQLGVVIVDPLWLTRVCSTWIKLDLVPYGILKQLSIREAKLLRTCIPQKSEPTLACDSGKDVSAYVPQSNVSANGLRDIFFTS